MTAFNKILAGGVAIAALASAAPAAAQYYPGSGYGSGYNSGGGIIGQVINSVISGGYGSGYGYNGYNNSYGQNPYSRYGSMGQNAINQCMGAVQQRLNASYSSGYGNNGYSNGYGYQQAYGGYNGARVLGISDIDQRSNGGLSIRGVANSGRSNAYGYGGYGGGYSGGYSGQGQVDLTFRCKTDVRGYIVDVDIEQATSAYGGYSNGSAYTPYNYDYSQYGYRRY